MKKLLYTAVVLGLFACNQTIKNTGDTLSAQIENEEVEIPEPDKGYKAYETESTWVMYPEGWSLDTSSVDSEFFIYSPLVESSDIFQENINLTTEKLPNNSITAEYYIKRALEMIKTSFGEVDVLENKERKGNFGTYRTIIYTGTMSGMKLKWKQSVYVKNSTAYIISYTSLDDTYDEFVEISNKVMNSFIVK